MFYFARCMNIIFNSLLAQLIKYDVQTTRKIKSMHAIFDHILLLYTVNDNVYFSVISIPFTESVVFTQINYYHAYYY